jgi:hypothetical protein
MAIQTRYAGDANPVPNVGTVTLNANAVIINTGISSPIQAFKITGMGGNLAAELSTGGAVETIVRTAAANATVIAYQVDSNSQISLITERSSDTATTLQNAIQALNGGGNIGVASTVTASGATVSTTGGIKFA